MCLCRVLLYFVPLRVLSAQLWEQPSPPAAGVSDGRDIETRQRDGDGCQATAVRVFWPGGETQTAVFGPRIVWYQRSGQVSSTTAPIRSFQGVHMKTVSEFNKEEKKLLLDIDPLMVDLTVSDSSSESESELLYCPTNGESKRTVVF